VPFFEAKHTRKSACSGAFSCFSRRSRVDQDFSGLRQMMEARRRESQKIIRFGISKPPDFFVCHRQRDTSAQNT
jgi:hypothetical protein